MNRLLPLAVCLVFASCGAPDPTCDDREKNGDETDVDCGGSCGGCERNEGCAVGGDCLSGVCEGGKCVLAPSCDDLLHNGDESDVDCGGSCETKCADGQGCGVAGDCVSGICEGSVCLAVPTCDDLEKNGDETGVDCGGETCGPCGDGFGCAIDDDCAEGLTCQELFCAPEPLACFDGFLCVQECSGAGAGACQTACLNRITPQGQSKMLAMVNCLNAGCPTSNGGVCDQAAAGHDPVACEACIDGLLDVDGECEDEFYDCVLDG